MRAFPVRVCARADAHAGKGNKTSAVFKDVPPDACEIVEEKKKKGGGE